LFEALEDRSLPTGIVVTGSPAGVPATVSVYSADTGALLSTLQPFAGFTGRPAM
jgi:hypothetical protein